MLDLDRDGDLDVLDVARSGWWSGNGDGTFGAWTEVQSGVAGVAIATGDLDGGGDRVVIGWDAVGGVLAVLDPLP